MSGRGKVTSAASQLRIVVLGYIVRGPLGGLAWHHLQYVMGLAALGHQVFFVEDSDDYPCCYNPVRGTFDTDPGYGLQFATDTFRRVGLGEQWAYYDAHTQRWLGPRAADMLSICQSSDLLLNLSGINPLRPWVMTIPVRALIDTDPVFTQIGHLTQPAARDLANRHTAFLSFGENIGKAGCSIPDDGFPWRPTRQPIVLEAWTVTPAAAEGLFTTVMQWESYPAREYQGQHYGMKSESFGPYLDLPARVGPVFELALGGATAPRDLLASRGWKLRDSREPTRDPWIYQAYIRNSKAEFGVAKQGYVASRSGWFSERSAAYLASGRPVVIQETGFSDWIEAGAGVLPFSSREEALAAVDEVNARWVAHSRAARSVAEEYFAADEVLSRMLEVVLSRPASIASGGRQ